MLRIGYPSVSPSSHLQASQPFILHKAEEGKGKSRGDPAASAVLQGDLSVPKTTRLGALAGGLPTESVPALWLWPRSHAPLR